VGDVDSVQKRELAVQERRRRRVRNVVSQRSKVSKIVAAK
jgi:hypothetical protein